jgi:hypothetical protein
LCAIIAGDGAWCFPYDVESKRKSLKRKQAASPRSKKVRMSNTEMKKILITFFDVKGIVHFEFISEGQTVNQAYYMKKSMRLRECEHRKFLNLGSAIEFSTITMLQLTRRPLLSSFWPKKNDFLK